MTGGRGSLAEHLEVGCRILCSANLFSTRLLTQIAEITDEDA